MRAVPEDELEKEPATAGKVAWAPDERLGFYVSYSHWFFSHDIFQLHKEAFNWEIMVNGTRRRRTTKPGSRCPCEPHRDTFFGFTVPVRLPAEPCGLNCISTSACTDVARSAQSCLSCAEHQHESYQLGSLYIQHPGLLHQIGSWTYRLADATTAPRVTIQGFAVKCRGTWYLMNPRPGTY